VKRKLSDKERLERLAVLWYVVEVQEEQLRIE
jgi:hypothetical protein